MVNVPNLMADVQNRKARERRPKKAREMHSRSFCHPLRKSAHGGLCEKCFETTHRNYVLGRMTESVRTWFERDVLQLGPKRPDAPLAQPASKEVVKEIVLAKFSVDSALPGEKTKDPLQQTGTSPPAPSKPGSTRGTFLAWVMRTMPHGDTRREFFWHDCSWGIPTRSKTGRYVCAHGFSSDGERAKSQPNQRDAKDAPGGS